MNDMSTLQSLLFIGTSAAGVTTLVLYFTRRKSAWLFILPWAAILLGAAWFLVSNDYYSQRAVQIDVPIRIDLVLFPLMMLFCCVVGTMRIYNWSQSRKPK